MIQVTSMAAYEKAKPRFGSNRAKVYQFIVDAQEYGATDQEMQDALKMEGNTLRPTRIGLVKDNLIYDSGRTRKNANDNDCIVWIVTEIVQGGLF